MMSLSLRNVLVFGFTAVLCAMLPAEILYVAPNGNDRNPGTLEKPLQTPRAVGRLLQGRPEVTEVVFKEGIYSADMHLKSEASIQQLFSQMVILCRMHQMHRTAQLFILNQHVNTSTNTNQSFMRKLILHWKALTINRVVDAALLVQCPGGL